MMKRQAKVRSILRLTFEELHQRLGLDDEISILDIYTDPIRERVELKLTSDQPGVYDKGVATYHIGEGQQIILASFDE